MSDVMTYAIYMAAFIAGGCTAFAIMNEGRGWKRMIMAWLAGNLVTAVVVPLFLFTLFAYLLIDVSVSDPDVGDVVALSLSGPIIGILMAAFLNRRKHHGTAERPSNPMGASPDYYATLGVLPTSEDIVIHGAFRELMRKYHPDRFQGDRDFAERRSKELNEAYSVLRDPEKRKSYDALTGFGSRGSTRSGSSGKRDSRPPNQQSHPHAEHNSAKQSHTWSSESSSTAGEDFQRRDSGDTSDRHAIGQEPMTLAWGSLTVLLLIGALSIASLFVL